VGIFRRLAACLVLTALCSVGRGQAASASEVKPPSASVVRLAVGGKPQFPVVIHAKASERVAQAARVLADYLGKMTGAQFLVVTGDGSAGIAVALDREFPALKVAALWDGKDPMHREDYLLRSHDRGVLVLGATELAVEYAIWDLLYRLGHRQFFPGPAWEVVPRSADLTVAVDVREHPAFVSRDIGYGLGYWDTGSYRRYTEWCKRNRIAAGTDQPVLNVYHAYHEIVAAKKDEFEKHPEYFALCDGKRLTTGEAKFCISNAGLRKLVADYAVEYFAKKPNAASVSLEASDELGWCECDKCRALGSVSDQVVVLVNEAAAAVRARHGDKKLIGVYAYGEHSPPPHVRVDPQVVVNVATSMTIGDFTTDRLIDGWRRQGAQIGIREYHGVYPWDRDLPGKANLANLAYTRESTRRFYDKGARFLTSESSNSWAVTGLGYYLAARMLWDVRETSRVEALTDDFFDKAFGPARKPMAEFYRLIDAASQPRLSRDLIGRLYRALEAARQLATDPAIATRVDLLTFYPRYLELYRDYAYVDGPERQRALERLYRFTYRIRHADMVHTLAVWRGLPYYDPTIKLPPHVGYDLSEDKDPWKEKTPVGPDEIANFRTGGIARNPLADFTPVTFSTDLVPVAPLRLPNVPTGNPGLYFRDRSAFYTWAADPPAELSLVVKAGVIYQNLGNAKLTLSTVGRAGEADSATVPPDQKDNTVRLHPRAPGLQRLEVSDRTAGTALTWPVGAPWAIPAGAAEVSELYGRWTLYFYVPKGTKVVAGYAQGLGELHDGAKQVLTFAGPPDYFTVPVAPGQDGRLWKFTNSLGPRLLLTVPPYLSRDASELLLPAEVVRADTTR
jgi:hypothetical protein